MNHISQNSCLAGTMSLTQNMYISYKSSYIIIFLAVTYNIYYSLISAVKQGNLDPTCLGLKPSVLPLNVKYYSNLLNKWQWNSKQSFDDF